MVISAGCNKEMMRGKVCSDVSLSVYKKLEMEG